MEPEFWSERDRESFDCFLLIELLSGGDARQMGYFREVLYQVQYIEINGFPNKRSQQMKIESKVLKPPTTALKPTKKSNYVLVPVWFSHPFTPPRTQGKFSIQC